MTGDDEPENTEFALGGKALNWLQRHSAAHPPIIIAPKAKLGHAITRFVPNNDGDRKPDRQERLTAKVTSPMLFMLDSNQEPEVHYAWPISNPSDCPINILERTANSLTALGWGIDMAFANARLAESEELQALKGIRWYPCRNSGSIENTLRVPTYDSESSKCTLSDLRYCHSTILNRIEHGMPLKTVHKPTVFDRVSYSSIERPTGRPFAVFKLVDDNDDTVSYPHAKLIHIAGMVRHLAIQSMKSYPPRDLRDLSAEQWVDQYVAGHRPRDSDETVNPHTQFSYVPLPSIGHEHTNPAVRRVMIVAPEGDDAWLAHLTQHLDGQVLKPMPGTKIPSETRLQLVLKTSNDGVRKAYTRQSRSWASFTPVILPGHNDKSPSKTRKLIQKALDQSGITQPCTFEWSSLSLFSKSYSAHKYVLDENSPGGKRPVGYIRPDHLKEQTAVHLTLTFDSPVPGPLTIGAGRHCGFGLMAAKLRE